MIAIREPQPRDIERIAVTMRPIDVAECRAAGHTPWQALGEAQRSSVLVWTGEVNGWPEAMFGVAPGNIVNGLGYPWFLGSERARKNARGFMHLAPLYLARIEVLFPRLEGTVSVRNTSALRWLVRMGFHVERHYTVLMRGEPMHRFTKGM